MSLVVEAVSSSKNMALDEGKEASAVETSRTEEVHGAHKRQMSEASCYYEFGEDEDEEGKGNKIFELGPQFTLKEHLEKDKVGFVAVKKMPFNFLLIWIGGISKDFMGWLSFTFCGFFFLKKNKEKMLGHPIFVGENGFYFPIDS